MPIKVLNENTDQQKEVCVLSYSSYSVYKQCPQRYYKEKCLKLAKQEDISYTVPGSIVHNAAEHFFKTGSFEKFTEDALKNELIERGKWSNVDLVKAYKSEDKALELLIKSAKNLEMFLVALDRNNKYMSEQWFGVWNAPLYLSENLGIQGAADLISINPNDTAILYDFKTSYNTKNISREQLILYCIAYKQKWNINITTTAFFMLPTNKFNYFTFTDFEKQQLLNQLQEAANEILTKKEKLPETPNDKCKFCPFYSDCTATQPARMIISIPEGTLSFDNFGADL